MKKIAIAIALLCVIAVGLGAASLDRPNNTIVTEFVEPTTITVHNFQVRDFKDLEVERLTYNQLHDEILHLQIDEKKYVLHQNDDNFLMVYCLHADTIGAEVTLTMKPVTYLTNDVSVASLKRTGSLFTVLVTEQ